MVSESLIADGWGSIVRKSNSRTTNHYLNLTISRKLKESKHNEEKASRGALLSMFPAISANKKKFDEVLNSRDSSSQTLTRLKLEDGGTEVPKVQTTAVTTKTQETPLLDEGYHSDCEDPILPSISSQSSRDEDGLKAQEENLRKKNTELLEKLAVALEQLEFMKLSFAHN
ncbi:hypothetical protein DAPPUDRAFT_320125 [Daphnia pulex]|uniref:Uncharacterized protein n=1 Tax=Daphnia pulex TaxID=6669 RepID=E9GNX5_DAPPU|nr:hypothetical protein DAPPUDRAFT_320125 [Daphnia pulex]|eukprot:EFX78870.1 hypothetical protein DAPPUDRAFT_320125 [Daphnia pulex]